MATKQTTPNFEHDAILDTPGASKLMKIPEATLIKWRSTGENNIPYIKIGKTVRYSSAALRAYIERHTIGGE